LNFHQQVASLISIALTDSVTTETGQMALPLSVISPIWFKIVPCLQNDDEVYCYRSCLHRIYEIICEEDTSGKIMYPYWLFFWSLVILKYPNTTVEFIPQFLNEIIEHRQDTLISIMPVGNVLVERIESYHYDENISLIN
jgi:hypothetical protein